MLKRILIAAMMWPLLALAQSYPSPTFQNLTVLGTFTASGNVGLPSLAAQAANTVVANITASSASPTAVSMPTCNTSSSALNYTPTTGFTCNTSINAATLGNATFAAPGPIGSTTASTGAFTTLSASSTVSGTGFSTYLASPPAIGGTAAAAGSFTTLTASGLITPSTTNGIKGTTAGDNAIAGSWGECLSPVTVTGVALTAGAYADVATITLTAGDWMVSGEAQFVPSGTAPNAYVTGWNTAVASQPSFPDNPTWTGVSSSSGGLWWVTMPQKRYNVTGSTTVRFGAQSNYSGGSVSVSASILACRRR